MRRAYKYRLFVNTNQARELATMVETHRRLHNDCLAQRKTTYEATRKSVEYAEQSAWFKAERAANPYFARLNFSSAQATMRRLDKSFVAFFRRVKAGQKPGYPRFKGRDRFDTVEFPTHGDGIRLTGNRLRVQHVGTVRVKVHRPHQGTIKTLSITREADKRFVVLSCDLGEVAVAPNGLPAVGIDMGLEHFLTGVAYRPQNVYNPTVADPDNERDVCRTKTLNSAKPTCRSTARLTTQRIVNGNSNRPNNAAPRLKAVKNSPSTTPQIESGFSSTSRNGRPRTETRFGSGTETVVGDGDSTSSCPRHGSKPASGDTSRASQPSLKSQPRSTATATIQRAENQNRAANDTLPSTTTTRPASSVGGSATNVTSPSDTSETLSHASKGLPLTFNAVEGFEFFHVANPRLLKAELPELRRRSRSLSRKKRGGTNRRKARLCVARLHTRVKNLRKEFHHQTTLSLARRFGLVAVESLNVAGMLRNHRLARSISDAGWSGFLLLLRNKAEIAGCAVVEVNCRGTSQECSRCGSVVRKELSVRTHDCPTCGLVLQRDWNAARNILARARQARMGLVGLNPDGGVSQEAARL